MHENTPLNIEDSFEINFIVEINFNNKLSDLLYHIL